MARVDEHGAAHARLSASESERWTNCPGSVEKINALPPELRRRSSFYADEGTAAHKLGELCLRNRRSAKSYLGKNIPGTEFDVTVEMADAVQVYVDLVKAEHAKYKKSELHLERRFDLTFLQDDMFGTCDAVVAQPFGRLVVIDYKHGKGVPVDVEDNSQLKYYGFGAASLDGFQYDVVELVIVQPRAPHRDGGVRRWEVSCEDLKAWGYDVLGPAAKHTLDPDAPLAAGKWCRFCAASSTCGELARVTQEAACVDFRDEPHDVALPGAGHNGPPGDDHAQRLADALRWLPAIDAWTKAVAASAHAAATAGMRLPGYKLVVGKEGNRKFADEKKAVKALVKAGVPEGDLYDDPKLKTPAQAEKLIADKAKRKALMDKITVRSPGKTTLAPETDPRPEAAPSAQGDFDAAEGVDYAD